MCTCKQRTCINELWKNNKRNGGKNKEEKKVKRLGGGLYMFVEV